MNFGVGVFVDGTDEHMYHSFRLLQLLEHLRCQ